MGAGGGGVGGGQGGGEGGGSIPIPGLKETRGGTDVDVGEATGWGWCFWQKKLSTY